MHIYIDLLSTRHVQKAGVNAGDQLDTKFRISILQIIHRSSVMS